MQQKSLVRILNELHYGLVKVLNQDPQRSWSRSLRVFTIFARIFKDLDQDPKGLQGSSRIQLKNFAKIFEDPGKDLLQDL